MLDKEERKKYKSDLKKAREQHENICEQLDMLNERAYSLELEILFLVGKLKV